MYLDERDFDPEAFNRYADEDREELLLMDREKIIKKVLFYNYESNRLSTMLGDARRDLADQEDALKNSEMIKKDVLNHYDQLSLRFIALHKRLQAEVEKNEHV